MARCAAFGRGVGARRARIRRAGRRSPAAASGDPRHGLLARPLLGLPRRRRIRRHQNLELGPILGCGHRGLDGGRPGRRGRALRRFAGGRRPASAPAMSSRPSTACPSITTTLADTIGRMRGKEGTAVKIGILREGSAEPLLFTLKRSRVQLHSVNAELPEPGYGYVRIAQFSDTTGEELTGALRDLRKTQRRAPQGARARLAQQPRRRARGGGGGRRRLSRLGRDRERQGPHAGVEIRNERHPGR